jgi:hypothetical protein
MITDGYSASPPTTGQTQLPDRPDIGLDRAGEQAGVEVGKDVAGAAPVAGLAHHFTGPHSCGLFFPPATVRIAREIPGARLLVLDEAGAAILDAAVGEVAAAMLAPGRWTASALGRG